jgi:CheY-like chemotaxis protein
VTLARCEDRGMSTSVLVVDDDVEFRRLVARMLRGLGLTVVAEAGTCAAARADIERTRPDAALVDIGLPDGDGVVLAMEFAGLAWRPRVVLTSSDADAVDDTAVQRTGVLGFIAKDRLADGSLRRLLTGVVPS